MQPQIESSRQAIDDDWDRGLSRGVDTLHASGFLEQVKHGYGEPAFWIGVAFAAYVLEGPPPVAAPAGGCAR